MDSVTKSMQREYLSPSDVQNYFYIDFSSLFLFQNRLCARAKILKYQNFQSAIFSRKRGLKLTMYKSG